MRVFRYASPLLLFIGSWQAFCLKGWITWLPIAYAFVLMPLVELLLKPDPGNLDHEREEAAKNNRLYDWLLYIIVPLQYLLLFRFLFSLRETDLSGLTLGGRIATMGLLCGVFGINVGHELGHRHKWFEQFLAQCLLLSSQYLHFFIEHNKGHHKRVATPEDPSSARLGEAIYQFYPRTILFSYFSAWQIASKETRKKGRPVISLYNEMMRFTLIQLAMIIALLVGLGSKVTLSYLAAAAIGILLLETVNYIEHYGLSRKPLGDGKYERALPIHSWNSDHLLGRVLLFELSRHSDHHFLASRKYQILRHHDASPQMPTGYPGMMLLSLFPPAWFYVMNRRARLWMNKPPSAEAVHPA